MRTEPGLSPRSPDGPVAEPAPIGFAHRGGARRRADQNTLRAFTAAVAAGALGLESDVLLTADRIPVLIHPRVRDRFGRSVATVRRDQLPASVPTLDDVYAACGVVDIALDMAAPGAVDHVVAVARRHGAASRLWLTYWRIPVLARWHQRYPDTRLVYPTLLSVRRSAQLRLFDRLSAAGVDAVNLYHRGCTPGRVVRAHDAGLLVFGWGARTGRAATRVLATGADGVFCDDTAGLVAALATDQRRRQRELSAAAGS